LTIKTGKTASSVHCNAFISYHLRQPAHNITECASNKNHSKRRTAKRSDGALKYSNY